MTDLRKNFGRQHAKHRRATGLTQEVMASRMGFAVKTLQMYEQGARTPTLDYAKKADEVLGLDGVLVNLAELCRADGSPFGSFRQFEQEATAIYDYEGFVVPGLLQTYEYALAVIKATSPELDAEEAAMDRIARQKRLHDENPPTLHVIIDESVLDREIGGPEVFRAQLEKLLDPGPGVTVRILPHGEHPGLRGSLVVLDLPDGDSLAFGDGQAPGGLMDMPDAVARCRRTWDQLSARALPIDVSADWIRAVLEDLR